jgi:Na+/proline symporter
MRLRALDFAVIIIYLIGITAFGAHFRKSQRSLKDYFLGGRTGAASALVLRSRRGSPRPAGSRL